MKLKIKPDGITLTNSFAQILNYSDANRSFISFDNHVNQKVSHLTNGFDLIRKEKKQDYIILELGEQVLIDDFNKIELQVLNRNGKILGQVEVYINKLSHIPLFINK